jgi:hypothetical protein
MLAAHVAATAQAAAAAHAEMSRVRGDAAEEASRLRSQCAGLEASLAGAKVGRCRLTLPDPGCCIIGYPVHMRRVGA